MDQNTFKFLNKYEDIYPMIQEQYMKYLTKNYNKSVFWFHILGMFNDFNTAA